MATERRTRPGDGPDLVYAGLRTAIIEQELPPGSRLAEDAVAARFAVSRTVVRSALERLVSEGLVERPNNRSATVARIGVEQAADLLAVRQGIEAMVMDRLAGALTAAQEAALQSHVQREERASSLNRPEAVRLAGEFHVMLAQATGSALLERYVSDIVSRSSLIVAGNALPHSSSCAVREHLELIGFLASGDVQAARRSMRDHLDGLAQRARLAPPAGGSS
jgi:DNA-binding GntR family transcriptional regulator